MLEIENTNIGTHTLLVSKDGKLILQQRDSNPEIVNPGQISMFGGTTRTGEDLFTGLKRELLEELELDVSKYSVEKLNTYYKTKETDNIDYIIHVYVVKDLDPASLILHEGRGFVVDLPKNLVNNPKLTRVTKQAVYDYIRAFC